VPVCYSHFLVNRMLTNGKYGTNGGPIGCLWMGTYSMGDQLRLVFLKDPLRSFFSTCFSERSTFFTELTISKRRLAFSADALEERVRKRERFWEIGNVDGFNHVVYFHRARSTTLSLPASRILTLLDFGLFRPRSESDAPILTPRVIKDLITICRF
jgi:hypothetical protein